MMVSQVPRHQTSPSKSDMPLNVPKSYAFTPSPMGAVKLISRSSRRSRLWAGGTFFRSIDRGEQANLLKLQVLEDLHIGEEDENGDAIDPEGLFVVHNTVLKPSESVFATGMSIPPITLFELNIKFDEEIRIWKENDSLVANITGIRWQIAGGEELRLDLGQVVQNRVLARPGVVTFKLDANADTWPDGAMLYLRPRTRRYTLVETDDTGSATPIGAKGWSIEALRGALNGTDPWLRMPNRPGPEEVGGQNEDGMDEGVDAQFLTAFDPTNMTGGDGLPVGPIGWNTGPDRVLVHLNYAERDDGSLGETNQVFEWVGDSALIGSWSRYV